MIIKKISLQYFKAFSFVMLWIGMDQWSKHAMRLTLLRKISITPFLSLSGIWNPGISFGLFPCHSPFERVTLLALSVIMVFFLVKQYILSLKNKPSIGVLLMIAGACGNLWDRLFHGKVFDFISVHFGPWDFPVFNLADMLISVGFLLLIIGSFDRKKPSETKKSFKKKHTNTKNP